MCRARPSANVRLVMLGGGARRAYSTINNIYLLFGYNIEEVQRICRIITMNTRSVIEFYFFTDRACLINNIPNDLRVGLYRVVPITDRNLQRFLLETSGGDDCARITYY